MWCFQWLDHNKNLKQHGETAGIANTVFIACVKRAMFSVKQLLTPFASIGKPFRDSALEPRDRNL